MIDPTTFYTLKVQMVATAFALLHILIRSLGTLPGYITDHRSVLLQPIQIPVNGGNVNFTVHLAKLLPVLSLLSFKISSIFLRLAVA